MRMPINISSGKKH